MGAYNLSNYLFISLPEVTVMMVLIYILYGVDYKKVFRWRILLPVYAVALVNFIKPSLDSAITIKVVIDSLMILMYVHICVKSIDRNATKVIPVTFLFITLFAAISQIIITTLLYFLGIDIFTSSHYVPIGSLMTLSYLILFVIFYKPLYKIHNYFKNKVQEEY